MCNMLSVQSKKIIVASHQHAPPGKRESAMFFIVGPQQFHLGGSGHVDTPTTKTGGNRGMDVPVKMEPHRHRLPGL